MGSSRIAVERRLARGTADDVAVPAVIGDLAVAGIEARLPASAAESSMMFPTRW